MVRAGLREIGFPQMPTRSASHLTGSVNSSPIAQGDFEKQWHEQERRGRRKRDENSDGHGGKTMAAMPVSLSTVTDVEPHGSGDRLAGEQVEIAFEHGTDTNVLASANPPNDGRWVSGHNTVERRADALHDGAESHGQSTLVAQASGLPYDMRQLNKVALCASPTEPFVGATGNEFPEVFHDSRFNPDYIVRRALRLGGACVSCFHHTSFSNYIRFLFRRRLVQVFLMGGGQSFRHGKWLFYRCLVAKLAHTCAISVH